MPRIERPIDRPLDEAVGYATHVLIVCRPPGFDARQCGHRAVWLTADLYTRLPQCRTVAEFKDRLRCSRCGRKGWLSIEAARR